MKPLRFVAAAGLAGAIALTGTTVTQAATPPAADHPAAVSQSSAPLAPQVSRIDERFLKMGHQFNIFEIAKAGQAVDKGRCIRVRQLGITEVGSHRRLDQRLSVVAARERVSLPDRVTPAQMRKLVDLAKRSGADFDRAWLRTQITVHRQELVKIERELPRFQSPEVKQLARETIRVLQRHLALTQAAQRTCRF